MVDDTSPSAPIRKYQPVRRASIAPATSVAPEAPVMVAPGAPTIESPVSQASREREAREAGEAWTYPGGAPVVRTVAQSAFGNVYISYIHMYNMVRILL